MIKYTLRCGQDHEFEAWFRNSSAFDHQLSEGQLACPQCADRSIEKSLMAPRIASQDKSVTNTPSDKTAAAEQVHAMWLELGRTLRKDAENVGTEFPETARKIHFNEEPPRRIWGQASLSEAKDLLDDGIAIVPLPDLPEDDN